MKKNRIICLFLTVMLLLSVLASCQNNDETDSTSEDSSATVSVDTTDYTLVKASIDSLYTGEVNRNLAKNLISKGKSYKCSANAHESYPDKSSYLTDGVFATNYYTGESEKKYYAGFSNNSVFGKLEIDLDLGSEYTNIADLGVSMCITKSFGISLVNTVEFYALGQDEKYVLVGTLKAPKTLPDAGLYDFELNLQGTIKTSKIKIVLKSLVSSWIFIDEVYAYTYEGEKEGETEVIDDTNKYYGGPVKIPEITQPTYWSESESNYNNTINLLSGLPQQIMADDIIDGVYASTQYNSTVDNTALTDGTYAQSATYSGSGWFRFTRGLARSVYYDLKNTSAITGYSFGFLKEESTGVKLPTYVVVSASENGKDWMEIEKITKISTDKASDIVRVQGDFKETYRARYIKISFSVATHIYADEFEILGTKKVGNAKALIPTKSEDKKYPNKYAAPADYNNTHDVLLSYIIPGSNKITKEQYMPHVAYLENDKVKDTLFDSYLYLPYVKFLYDGQTKKALTKADWQSYIDCHFEKDVNMDALEAAVAETKTALGKSDYKVGVFLSILYPVTSQTSFGEVNGKNLDFSKLEDRKAAIKWLIDEQIKGFKAKGYQNIELKGFYWFTEELDYEDEGLVELIKFTTDYVRQLKYFTFWIPYYQAAGYNNWQDVGFDLACYQPNYAFKLTTPTQRLYDAARAAKLLGMCIELEIGGSSAADVDRLKTYYRVGAETGYMTDAIHMYYVNGMPGSIYNAYKSTDPYIHSLYKDTYLFIKGQFKADMVAAKSQSFECKVSEAVKGSVTVDSASVVKGYVVTTAPKYGSIQVNADGSFEYKPTKGITCEDYFEVCVDYGFGVSEPAKISISVK
jgi:hypothetical protein